MRTHTHPYPLAQDWASNVWGQPRAPGRHLCSFVFPGCCWVPKLTLCLQTSGQPLALCLRAPISVTVGNSGVQGPGDVASHMGTFQSIATSPETRLLLVLSLPTSFLFPLEAPKGNSSSNSKETELLALSRLIFELPPSLRASLVHEMEAGEDRRWRRKLVYQRVTPPGFWLHAQGISHKPIHWPKPSWLGTTDLNTGSLFPPHSAPGHLWAQAYDAGTCRWPRMSEFFWGPKTQGHLWVGHRAWSKNQETVWEETGVEGPTVSPEEEGTMRLGRVTTVWSEILGISRGLVSGGPHSHWLPKSVDVQVPYRK